ncbi:hypothetical protein U1740_20990, partial [Aeromonas caviae]|uniref:hypothetical protein n=1 Tax=Aeromonas caviae TaxID=648 RepID=UPI00301431C6
GAAMMIYLQKRVIDQNGRSPSSTENSKIRCGMTGNGSFAQAKLAVTGNAVEFGRREKLLKIVVGIDNGHGFVRGGFVWR